MIRKLIITAGLALLTPAGGWAAKLHVVTTTTDLASIVRQIGGEDVEVLSLSSGFQNPHFVEAKPSLVVRLMEADLFIETGMELEVGWVPLLVQNSRNKKIFPGAAGHLNASERVKPLEVPSQVSRAMGDVHPEGNPHYMADPLNALIVAQHIAERLSALAPAKKDTFRSRHEAFKNDLQSRLEKWTAKLAAYRGEKFVSYHRDWTYFAHRFGLVLTGELEPKPGIPPTGPHLAGLITTMKRDNVKIIITDPWYEKRSAEYLARETGAQVLELALFPGARKGLETYQDTIDYNVSAVADALKRAGQEKGR